MLVRTGVFASVLVALGLALPAAAQGGLPQLPAAEQTPITALGHKQDEDPSMLARLKAEEAVLIAIRSDFPALFAEAYSRYPQIPTGVLEAIAYSQTRWMPLAVEAGHNENHHHMPTAHGVMGLYGGEGFTDQLSQAAALLGVPADRIAKDNRYNILGAAALLAQEIDGERRGRRAKAAPALEDLTGALARYAGFTPVDDKSAIDDFARESFVFDVLLALDRGVNEKGMLVPEHAIQWEKAFPVEKLVRLRAPFVRLDLTKNLIDTGDFAIDPITETLVGLNAAKEDEAESKSTDYGPAIWNVAHSSNYTASRSAAVSAVTLHTAQGSYAGTISWFKNSAANVSAHYVIRSSDGQVTQMVRHAHTGWHVRNHNAYTLGIEHEGYVNNSSWYTTAMYNASAALVRHFCASYSAISCASAYKGAPSSGINVLADSVKIKGHQHFSGQTHTDPGINWNWANYYNLLNPGSGGGGTGATRILASFESTVGPFNTSPAYSGSTTGISTASTALRDCSMRKNGTCSLQVKLVDNASSSAAWAVRLLSGSGTPASNTSLTRANGKVGFWVYSGGTGLSAALGIDDSDGTERSIARTIPANTWTYLEWNLADAAHWDAWVGGNGAITASTVTLDAIWFYRAQTAYNVFVYIDDVQIRN
ncbi:peptidoglycan recognition family protein [Xanthomonadaceae bacterium XH05]|nr:peptidoglycan recognition family protein [Xanthomonadaceae bacterium XH05]